MRILLLFLLLVTVAYNGYGQSRFDRLDLSLTHYYSLTKDPLPAKLERYPSDETEAKIAAIVEAGRATSNFEAIACNVASIVVARQGKRRYLLYNPGFLASQSQEILATMSLATAVGYHINNHQLFSLAEARSSQLSAEANARYVAESLEATRFAGFALYNLENITSDQIINIVFLWAILKDIPPSELIAAMQIGYDKAAALLLLGPSAAYEDRGDGQSLPGIPEFPFPPPKASTTLDISQYFTGSREMGDIADRLEQSLTANGYFEHQYYYVNGGFALVTRIEQYKADGSSHEAPGRWSANPFREEGSWVDYLRDLFTDNPGRYRVFVFLVTNSPLVTDSSRKVDRQTAEAWLSEGASSLPVSIREQRKNESTTVTTLIYDFLKSSGNGVTVMTQPSPLPSLTHLEKSNILNYIRP